MQKTEIFTIPKSVKLDPAKFSEELGQFGLITEPIKTEYELFRAKGDAGTLVIYTSGKVVLQAKGDNEKLVSYLNNLSGKETVLDQPFVAHIGSDEVGKGDFFGPLVVCACYVDESNLPDLKRIGVGDSKKINDAKILDMYAELSTVVDYEAVITSPEMYNLEYSHYKNASILLSYKHGEAAKGLLQKLETKNTVCDSITIDQFSSRKDRLEDAIKKATDAKLKVTQFHKGESDIAVAAASVIARATFLLEWEKMEQEWGFKFPKGATDVISAGKLFIKNYGKENLNKVAKTSFITAQQL